MGVNEACLLDLKRDAHLSDWPCHRKSIEHVCVNVEFSIDMIWHELSMTAIT
jgi:hypothetical protein